MVQAISASRGRFVVFAVGLLLAGGLVASLVLSSSPLSKLGSPADPDIPSAAELSRMLGVPVTEILGEAHQHLLLAPQGTVNFARVGHVHTDLGYAVGVTLPNGKEIGFRYDEGPSHKYLSQVLAAPVRRLPGKRRHYLVEKSAGMLDLSKLGAAQSQNDASVMVTLLDGSRVALLYAPPEK